MAYNLKYYSTVYDVDGNGFDVNLYQDGYSGTTFQIRIKGMNFERKMNNNVSVASITVQIANTFTFGEFNELVTGYEKEWKLEVVAADSHSVIFFEGCNVVTVLEQEMHEYGVIQLTFNDALPSLEHIDVTDVTFGEYYSLWRIIKDGLDHIDTKEVYINSTLSYLYTELANDETFFEITALNADFFYENNVETRNYLDVFNEILTTFRMYLYYHKDSYYMERIDDINSAATHWVHVDDNSAETFSGTTVSNEIHNKQDDFEYLRLSQRLISVPGWSDLELNLKFREFVSMLPNQWTLPLSTISYGRTNGTNYPDITQYDLNSWNEWHIMEEVGAGQVITTGVNGYAMNNYIKYDYDDSMQSLVYGMHFTKYASGATRVQVKFKIHVGYPSERSYSVNTKFYIRFALKEGDVYNEFICENDDGEAEEQTHNTGNYIWQIEVENPLSEGGLIEFSQIIDIQDINFNETPDQLIFEFYPTKMKTRDDSITYVDNIIMGDFEVKVLSNNPDNQYLYDINDDFNKRESQEMSIIAPLTPNYNFTNTIRSLSGNPIGRWTDNSIDGTHQLDDDFVKDIVGYRYKTRRELKAKIKFNEFTWIKPFCFLTDDNLTGLQFMVTEYSYNFVNGQYDIQEAIEYSTEKGDIIISE